MRTKKCPWKWPNQSTNKIVNFNSWFCPINLTIFPCSSFTDSKMKLGNVRNQSFVELLRSKKILSLRERWKTEVKTHCDNCKFSFICNGSCPEYSYMDTDDIIVNENECTARYRTFSYIEKRLNEFLPKELIKLVKNPSLAK